MWYPEKDRTDQLDKERQELGETQVGQEGDTQAFLTRVSAYIRFLAGLDGVPSSYLQDWIWIGSQYRIRAEHADEAFLVARAYLLQLERLANSPSSSSDGLLRDIRWITESGVAALRAELGLASCNVYLTEPETNQVERALREYRQSTRTLTEEQIRSLQDYRALFDDVRSETYHPGIAQMVDRLIEAATTSSEGRSSATACLQYVLETNDVVPDTVGYLGLVDDLFAIEETLRRIEHRDTWEPVLGRFYESWPFIDRVAFTEPDRTTRLPPYLQLIGGHALHDARPGGQNSCIVLPEVGLNGMMVAFLAAIQCIRDQTSQSTLAQPALKRGDDIILGEGASSVRVRYVGRSEYEGKVYEFVELRDGGKHSIDPSLLAKARRAAQPHRTLSTHRDFQTWKHSYSPPSLTHLVGQEFSRGALQPGVLLLTRRNRLDRMIERLRPMNHSIPDLVGLTYISSTGREESYGGDRSAQSVIWACSDPLTVRETLEGWTSDDSLKYVISDEGLLAKELEYLLPPAGQRNGMSCIALCGFSEREEVRSLIGEGYKTWFLRETDVSLLSGDVSPPSQIGSGEITRYVARQVLQSQATSQLHEVQCEPIEYLHLYLRELRAKADQSYDAPFDLLVVAISRFLRRFSQWPLEFNELERGELHTLLRGVADTCSLLTDFDQQVLELSEFVEGLLSRGIPDNPRVRKIEELLSDMRDDTRVAVVCNSAQTAATCAERSKFTPVLGRAEWISISELRDTGPVDRAIVPCWIDRKSMRELRNSGYARHFDLVLYGFEADWEKRSRNGGLAWERQLASRMRHQWTQLQKEFGEIPCPSGIRTSGDANRESDEFRTAAEEDQDDLLDTRIIDRIRAHTAQTSGSSGTTKAQLITFEDPGTFIYLRPRGMVISLSHALETIQEQEPAQIDHHDNAERLVSATVDEINSGDLLAFPADNTSDLLDDVADRILRNATETRRTANLWRTALQSHLRQCCPTVGDLQRRLESAGLKRHTVTIRMWMAGDQIVAPQNFPEAIPIIAKVTGHRELGDRVDDVVQAIDLIYRARSRAASEILKELTSKKIHLKEGETSVRIEGHEVRYRLHRVLKVGVPEEVPQELIGILQNISTVSSQGDPFAELAN